MLVTAALLAAAASTPVATREAEACKRPEVITIDRAGEAEPKRLDRLPPADMYYAVDHRVRGCLQPIKIRERR